MISVGIDPGTTNPGCATIRRISGRWCVQRLPVLHSLEELADELAAILQGPRPNVFAVEGVAWANHATRQGNGSGRILEAVGMVRLAAQITGAQLHVLAPQTWRKRATGSGNVTKQQVREFMRVRLSGWPTGPVSLNRSDAAGIAMAGADSFRRAG